MDGERERECVSVVRESGEILLSHILFWWEVWSPLSPHSLLSLLTSDPWLQLELFLIRSQDSDL